MAARVESPLGFRVGGKVAERFVNVGQHVKRGETLMRLDLADFDLSVKRQQADVDAAHALWAKATADLGRMQGLVEAGALSARAFDEAQEAQGSTRARWEAARAQLDLAKNAYRYADLRADSDGTVVERFADVGQVVSAGQSVVTLAQEGAREALIDLPETLRPALGSAATARLYAQPAQSFPAQLRELSGSADPSTRTYRARYVVDGIARDTPLGSTVIISIAHPAVASERRVPLSAIYDRGEGPGLWVLASDNSVHYRAVKMSRIDDEDAVLSEGIDPGEKVIGLGAHQLHEGQKVRPVPMEGGRQ